MEVSDTMNERIVVRERIRTYLSKALKIGHRTEASTLEYLLLEKSAAMFETIPPEVNH